MGLGDVVELDEPVDFRDDRALLRTTGFEELDQARETARDVLLLGRHARDLHQYVAGIDGLSILNHQMRA